MVAYTLHYFAGRGAGELIRQVVIMVAYTLHYFPGRGAGEVIRQIFVHAGQDFTDNRITKEEWADHKAEMPFGQMPVLEVDGKKLPQSYAIARYLARKFNLAGKCDWPSAQVDAIADQWKDFGKEITPYILVLAGYSQGDLEQLRKDVYFPSCDKHLPIFEKAASTSGSGFLVGDSLTWVDLLVAEFLAHMVKRDADILDKYPALKDLTDKVHSIPSIRTWRETRPVTDF